MVSIDTMGKQINVRLETDMLKEIDALAKVMHLSRTDWIRVKIAEGLRDDILKHSDTIILSYFNGRISGEELKTLLGKNAIGIAKEMYPDLLKKR